MSLFRGIFGNQHMVPLYCQLWLLPAHYLVCYSHYIMASTVAGRGCTSMLFKTPARSHVK
ncbi:hypothetical protein HKD37_19G054126 [Glycine soja]